MDDAASSNTVRNPSPSQNSDSDASVGTSLSQESYRPTEGRPQHTRSALSLALAHTNGPAKPVTLMGGNGPLVVPTSAAGGDLKAESEKSAATSRGNKKQHRSSEWEILEGLREGQRCEVKPEKVEGYLLKRRKWPLKGWHKRYFCLDRGILNYAKSSTEMARGKLHGTVDVGLSVISTKSKGRRMDIDTEEFIYHLKVKNTAQFQQWVSQLNHHRLYRQHEISFGTREAPKITTPVDDVMVTGFLLTDVAGRSSASRDASRLVRSPASQQQNRVAAWILDSTALDQGNRDLAALQEKLFHMSTLLQHLETLSSAYTASHLELPAIDTISIKKERRRFHLKKSKKNAKSLPAQPAPPLPPYEGPPSRSGSTKGGVEIVVSQEQYGGGSSSGPDNVSDSGDSRGRGISNVPMKDMGFLSSSHPSLLTDTSDASAATSSRHSGLPESSSVLFGTQNLAGLHMAQQKGDVSQGTLLQRSQEEFLSLSKDVHSGLRSLLRSLQTERERLKQLLESEGGLPSGGSSGSLITNLRNSLNQAIQQNTDLRLRLNRIHEESNISAMPALLNSPGGDGADDNTLVHQPLQPSLSHESSSVLSTSEYFDAPEVPSNASTSSEASLSDEEESFLSDGSDEGTEYTPIPSVTEATPTTSCNTGRRSKLPSPKPDLGDFSLWGVLCKNIGKDLSKVSMPVTLNEPLSVLQRLCEELEYSELLDKAAETVDPYERMVYIAAFAVSSYSSSFYRAGHKPFNPLLGETYECIRDDRGFRFIAEQVSHHPPVSACYGESSNFIFWQDMRVKTKFWGKSMEIVPFGNVHVLLPKLNVHYVWNKVTTCVHNLFSGQRWVDQYGEMTINELTGEATTKLTFVKASYWSSKRHEVFGGITNRDGEMVHRLFGKWTEALYYGTAPSMKCAWRPCALPEDYELYYGFTRFAIELNELDPDTAKILPPTDTRFRPDQRLLEEGNVNAAENVKTQLEQGQRDRRKRREELKIEYNPLWFSKVNNGGPEDEWIYKDEYWEKRTNPAFVNMTFAEKLW